jgi:hypothetical protein
VYEYLAAPAVGIARAVANDMTTLRCALSLLLLAAAAGCEHDLVNDTPDGAVDAVPLPAGDFSCVGVEWPTHVKDPFPISGNLSDAMMAPIAGATVEVHDVDTDALLAQTTSSSSNFNKGKWATSIPTGGVAQKIYRKASDVGYLDIYEYDAFPEFAEFPWGVSMVTQEQFDGLFQLAGLTPDRSLGVLWVEVWDCYPPGTTQIKATEGATFEAPPGAKIVYYDGTKGMYDTSLTSTTSGWAAALIVGVQPGLTDVVVHAGPLTYRSWPITVRANAITYSPRQP